MPQHLWTKENAKQLHTILPATHLQWCRGWHHRQRTCTICRYNQLACPPSCPLWTSTNDRPDTGEKLLSSPAPIPQTVLYTNCTRHSPMRTNITSEYLATTTAMTTITSAFWSKADHRRMHVQGYNVLVKKISRTFPGLSRTPEAFFQDPVICQWCIITANFTHYRTTCQSAW